MFLCAVPCVFFCVLGVHTCDVWVCVCVCVFIKLHITAQSYPVELISPSYSHPPPPSSEPSEGSVNVAMLLQKLVTRGVEGNTPCLLPLWNPPSSCVVCVCEREFEGFCQVYVLSVCVKFVC